MPVVFIRHGTPMNAIEQNNFTQRTKILTEKSPRTIHDFFGFPKALYDVQYPATGSPETRSEILSLLENDGIPDTRYQFN